MKLRENLSKQRENTVTILVQENTGNLKAKLSDTVFRLAKSPAQALDKITVCSTTILKTQCIPE